jgi:hypothetical protein
LTALEAKLRRVSRRLRFLRGLSATLRCLFFGLVAATFVVVVHKLVDLGALYGLAVAVSVVAAIPYGIGSALAAAGGVFDAAVAADERLGLKDRTASAVAVTGSPYPMAGLVLADAERAAQRIDPARHFPFRMPGLGYWLPAPLAAMMLLAAFCPEFDLLGRRETKRRAAAEQQVISRQADEIKRLARELEKRPDARESKKEQQILKHIDKVAEELSRTRDKQKAMMALSDVADKLSEEQKKLEDIRKVSEKMKELAEKKADEGGLSEAKKIAEKLGGGDFRGAAAEMRALSDKIESMAKQGELSGDKLESLKRELDALAQTTREMEKVSRGFEKLAQDLPRISETGEYAGLEFEQAAAELEGLDKLSPEDLKRLAELARRAQLEMMQRKLEVAKGGSQGSPQQGSQQGNQGGQQGSQGGQSCPKCGQNHPPGGT